MIHVSEAAERVLDNVTNLDNARLRKQLGLPLTDESGPRHPRVRIRPGMHVTTPTGLIIYVREVGWVEGELHARYCMGGANHSVPVRDLIPSL